MSILSLKLYYFITQIKHTLFISTSFLIRFMQLFTTFVCVCVLFGTGFCVTLAVLELTLKTRLASKIREQSASTSQVFG